MLNQNQLIQLFSSFRPDATFLSIQEYTNLHDETSNFSISFHISYLNCMKTSFDIISKHKPINQIQKIAKEEVLSSLKSRIENKTPIEERDDPYIHYKDMNGNIIKGIKSHKTTNQLYLFGLLTHKRIIKQGIYKNVNSSQLTIEKRAIEKLAPISRFRQFILFPKSYKCINVENIILK
jgi:hypothetical protein